MSDNSNHRPFAGGLLRANPLVYPPLGRCMYCGSKDRLSREHIVPRGLGGNIILPRSSCERCRKITQKFEESCLRKNFLYFRIHTGLHQHEKERPTHLPVRIRGKGVRLVLPSSHPNWLILPSLGRPGLLSGAPLGMPYFVHGFHRTNPKDLPAIKDKYPNEYFEVDYQFDVNVFVKMLAKIAHGLVCAILFKEGQFSKDFFNPYLPPFILGRNDNLGPFLIGQINYESDPPIDSEIYKYFIYEWQVRDKNLIVVGVRLFSNWRGLIYTVIVGERLKPSIA
jgi:HNH endonuclease